jgi:two-component system sensor histidine kinase KdpD
MSNDKEKEPDKVPTDRPPPRQLSLSDVLNPASSLEPGGEIRRATPDTFPQQAAEGIKSQPIFWRPYRSRGTFKIFLGAAAGVGKTYAMLEEARDLKEQGIDVAIGYVELHGRKDTEKLLDGFETLPRLEIEYRGTILEEMDTGAVVARQPQLVLVDELAHTNAPGLSHEKRYEDIEEILAAGIDVYSTVNVQHLESLNDRVYELTKTRVRETFPDRILDLADNVVLIDLPPEELRERIRQGKVYRPEKIYQALNNFFKTSNLVVLRELALRETADAVETSAAQLGQKETFEEELLSANAFVLICVSLKAQDAGVIRKGWRFARRLNAPVEVVTVWPDDDRKAAQEAAIAPLRRLARSLKMPFVELSGDPVEMIVNEAHTRRATLIVIGESTRITWKERLFGSFTDKILRGLDGVDIYIVGGASI